MNLERETHQFLERESENSINQTKCPIDRTMLNHDNSKSLTQNQMNLYRD